MKEQWKDIEGFEGYLQVSDLGRIKSLARTTTGKVRTQTYPEKILKLTPRNKKDRYLCYRPTMGGKKLRMVSAHIEVAKAFLPNPENKPTVDHINGDKNNNSVSNLRWATQKEQVENSMRLGTHYITKGELQGGSILTNDQAKEVISLLMETTLTYPEIAAKFDVHRDTIGAIKLGKNWAHLSGGPIKRPIR